MEVGSWNRWLALCCAHHILAKAMNFYTSGDQVSLDVEEYALPLHSVKHLGLLFS